MNRFQKSFESYAGYPSNLLRHSLYGPKADAYGKKLAEGEQSLFCSEDRAEINFLEYNRERSEFDAVCVTSASDLRKHLTEGWQLRRHDPQSRFVFIHAPHSRERLRTTKQMFQLILSYHQVIPAFLDFILPLGRQESGQDFNISGFWEDDCVYEGERALAIPEMGRSGRYLRFCYSLKSAEPSSSNQSTPWSIRQTCVYHSFDVETGQAFWIVVRPDKKMNSRITSAINSEDSKLKDCETRAQSFTSSLAAHVLICEWAEQHWRWYIDYIEKMVQEATRTAVSHKFSAPSPNLGNLKPPSAQQTIKDVKDGPVSTTCEKTSPTSKHSISLRPKKAGSPLPPAQGEVTFGLPRRVSSFGTDEERKDGQTIRKPEVSLQDLQHAQYIEELATAAHLSLKANINVLQQLKSHYLSFLEHEKLPEIFGLASHQVKRFTQLVTRTEKEFITQSLRLDALLRVVDGRKSLLRGVLEFWNTELSMKFTEAAHQSTVEMQETNQAMHLIAKQTKREAVSMRILTIVTLFFLPGTFISTLMSTPIVSFPDRSDAGLVSAPALRVYAAASVPLMFTTFIAWYAVDRWYKWKEQRSKDQTRCGRDVEAQHRPLAPGVLAPVIETP